jgi:hypothetical protein
MKKVTVLIVMAAVGLAILSAGPSYAKEPKKEKMKGVYGGKLFPKPAKPSGKPFFLKPLAPPAKLKTIAALPSGPYVGPEAGLAAGLFAGIPSVAGEVRFHKILGIDGTALKAGLRFAEGKDANETARKNGLIFADGIFNLNRGPGAVFYLGGGLNYLAYTTGQSSGTVGGEAYLGVQEGSFYAEAGYAAIRTGFSPSYKGLDLNLGFKWVY